MATKKKVMVDDSVKVVKPVHQPKLREEREDNVYLRDAEEDDESVLDRIVVEHTLEEAIMNIYFTGEFDATIVKKYDNTPLQKGWYGFYY